MPFVGQETGLINNDAANPLALAHHLKTFVDVFQLQVTRDERIDLDLAAMGRSRRTGGLADPAGSVEADVADALAFARPFRPPCPTNQAFSTPAFFAVQVAT